MNRRYFFLAVNTGFNVGGDPDERCIEFYKRRGGHGLYCAVVGNVVVPGGVGSNGVSAAISTSPSWAALAQAISGEGAIAGIQLASAWEGYSGMKGFRSRTPLAAMQEYRDCASRISLKDWNSAFDGLKRGTELSVNAGFGHVQLHAAHGYLFNLLVDHRLCQYADRSLLAIEKWAQELSAAGIQSSLRFSIRSGCSQFDQTSEDFVESIVSLPVDFFDVSSGFYNVNKLMIYPYKEAILQERVTLTRQLAQSFPGVEFVISGKSALAWSDDLEENLSIGMCRDLIANPDFLLHRNGGCKDRMRCHYYSRGEAHLSCGVWR